MGVCLTVVLLASDVWAQAAAIAVLPFRNSSDQADLDPVAVAPTDLPSPLLERRIIGNNLNKTSE